MQVWLQSSKNRLTLCMPTRAVSMWQVNDLMLLLLTVKLWCPMVTAKAFGAHLVGDLGCVGTAMFSRRGPFGLRDGRLGSACWLVGRKATEAARQVRPKGAGAAGSKSCNLSSSAHVRSLACVVSPRVSHRCSALAVPIVLSASWALVCAVLVSLAGPGAGGEDAVLWG